MFKGGSADVSVHVNITADRGDGRALRRPAVNWVTDRWDVTVHDSELVDPRIWPFFAAMKSSVDNDRRREQEDDEDDE